MTLRGKALAYTCHAAMASNTWQLAVGVRCTARRSLTTGQQGEQLVQASRQRLCQLHVSSVNDYAARPYTDAFGGGCTPLLYVCMYFACLHAHGASCDAMSTHSQHAASCKLQAAAS